MSENQGYSKPTRVDGLFWSLDIQRDVLNQLMSGCRYRTPKDLTPDSNKLIVSFEERIYVDGVWENSHLTHTNRKILVAALKKSLGF
jgi:hypothetical protein